MIAAQALPAGSATSGARISRSATLQSQQARLARAACSQPCASGVVARSRRRHMCVAAVSSGRGGSVLDRPAGGGWSSDRDSPVLTAPVTADTGNDSGSLDRAPPGGGNYRVLLLRSDSHTEQRVVKAITVVVPGADEAHARNCHATAMELGMAIVTTCLKEHAEHYSQQLYVRGCKSAIEPDGITV